MAKIKFGTSGWRAVISDEFTIENVRVVTQAIAGHIKDKGMAEMGVVVGYDTRFMAEIFAAQAACTLAANGVKAYLSDRSVPTPVISFEIIRRKAAGGINITASHNPPEYSGIKFSPEWGGPALPETTSDIEDRANALMSDPSSAMTMDIDEARHKGLVEDVHMVKDYLDDLKSKIDFTAIEERSPRVAIDPIYGTARGSATRTSADTGRSLPRSTSMNLSAWSWTGRMTSGSRPTETPTATG